jgi:hypothetical protein
MHSQDLSEIEILRWGARATGTNIDWCSTPGIKQKVTFLGGQTPSQMEYDP